MKYLLFILILIAPVVSYGQQEEKQFSIILEDLIKIKSENFNEKSEESDNHCYNLTLPFYGDDSIKLYLGDSNSAPRLESNLENYLGTKVLVLHVTGECKKDVQNILNDLLISDDFYCERKTLKLSTASSSYYFYNILKDIRIQIYTSSNLDILTID